MSILDLRFTIYEPKGVRSSWAGGVVSRGRIRIKINRNRVLGGLSSFFGFSIAGGIRHPTS